MMAILENSNKMLSVGIKKALGCSRIHSITRTHGDLEFLVSRWSMESHTFVVAWGEFTPTVEDVLNIFYGKTKAMGPMLVREDQDSPDVWQRQRLLPSRHHGLSF